MTTEMDVCESAYRCVYLLYVAVRITSTRRHETPGRPNQKVMIIEPLVRCFSTNRGDPQSPLTKIPCYEHGYDEKMFIIRSEGRPRAATVCTNAQIRPIIVS